MREEFVSFRYKKRIFILLDFNCAFENTHHWSSMAIYGNFLKVQRIFFEFWVPFYVSPNVYLKMQELGSVNKCLRSNQYFSKSLYKSSYSFLLATITNLFLAKLQFRFFKKINVAIRYALLALYLVPVIVRLINANRKYEVTLVFPTLDYLGLWLIKLLLPRFTSFNFYIRRTGAELHSPFSTGKELDDLLNIVDSEDGKRVRIGIPTLNLLRITKARVANPSRIFWSPLPSVEKNHTKIFNLDQKIRIGFPGTAKMSKGFDDIPKILEKISKEKIDFKVYIQKASYPWVNYEKSRQRIISICPDLIEYDAVLSVNEYELFLDQLDIIILPYQKKYYEEADSGILYEAADRGIPIICNSGLGFTEEVVRFGIGISQDQFKTFKEAIYMIISKETLMYISAYNKLRNQKLVDFFTPYN